MMFPEDTRSLTARLNLNYYGYGTGQFLQAILQAKMLLIYFRWDTL